VAILKINVHSMYTRRGSGQYHGCERKLCVKRRALKKRITFTAASAVAAAAR